MCSTFCHTSNSPLLQDGKPQRNIASAFKFCFSEIKKIYTPKAERTVNYSIISSAKVTIAVKFMYLSACERRKTESIRENLTISTHQVLSLGIFIFLNTTSNIWSQYICPTSNMKKLKLREVKMLIQGICLGFTMLVSIQV